MYSVVCEGNLEHPLIILGHTSVLTPKVQVNWAAVAYNKVSRTLNMGGGGNTSVVHKHDQRKGEKGFFEIELDLQELW